MLLIHIVRLHGTRLRIWNRWCACRSCAAAGCRPADWGQSLGVGKKRLILLSSNILPFLSRFGAYIRYCFWAVLLLSRGIVADCIVIYRHCWIAVSLTLNSSSCVFNKLRMPTKNWTIDVQFESINIPNILEVVPFAIYIYIYIIYISWCVICCGIWRNIAILFTSKQHILYIYIFF